jgi:ABC-type spermidine/putrescine transport system permease subunit I
MNSTYSHRCGREFIRAQWSFGAWSNESDHKQQVNDAMSVSVSGNAAPGLSPTGSAAIFFIVPALVVVGAVIIFRGCSPCDERVRLKIGSVAHFIGFENYTKLATNQRFHEAIVHTLYFTLLAVVVP